MLIQLKIKHLATIQDAELTFSPHLSVLTGLSGSGKSVLLSALRLLSGERSDRSRIRPGHSSASVCATFDLRAQPEVLAWLEAHELHVDPAACLIERIMSTSGGSISLHGHPINQATLKHLMGHLLHVHGQHQQQSLAKPHTQRALLDTFMRDTVLMNRLKTTYHEWLDRTHEMEALKQQVRSPEALDLLRFKQQELAEADLEEGEWLRLKEAHDRLSRADERDQGIAQAMEVLKHDEEHALLSRLEHLNSFLAACNDAQSTALIEQATVALEELAHHLEHMQPAEPAEQAQQLAEMDARMSLLFQWSRKYRVPPEELPALSQKLTQEHEAAEHAEQRLVAMEEVLQEARTQYLEAARQITQAREHHAPLMAEAINHQLKALGMAGSWITLMCLPYEDTTPRPEGLEQVHMIFHPHEGLTPQPVQKIASGGELSRLSLAIHRTLATQARIPTLVFDEVDVGISGHTASLVAQELHALSRDAQVLCVTHLPQVAAKGDVHYLIEKETEGEVPTTQVRWLDHKDRVQALADMLGGHDGGYEAAGHAERLLSATTEA